METRHVVVMQRSQGTRHGTMAVLRQSVQPILVIVGLARVR